MILSQQEYDAIISDETKIITGDIIWDGNPNSPTRRFRIDIDSNVGQPLFVDGWCNFYSGKLSYSIIHRSVGRIYGLDLGADHQNPDGRFVGEKHKNYWVSGFRDKWAYVPDDITGSWQDTSKVWRQFCSEARINHRGEMSDPPMQGVLII